MLNVNNIHKGYTDSHGTVPLFKQLNLQVDTGNSAAIMGASGCGKSTLLHSIASLSQLDKGSIELLTDDNSICISQLNQNEADVYRRDSVGIVFQRYNLIEYLTAIDNILLPAKHKQNLDINFIDSLCEQLQIQHLLKKSPSRLSGGEQQRVAIARALSHKPALVLADEPTGNLDPRTSDIVARLLFDLCKETKTTFVIVTHSAEIANMADDSYDLENLCLTKRMHQTT